MPPTYLDMATGTAWDNCGICEHLSPTHNLSQALTPGLPAKLSSVQLQASRRSMPRADNVSAINVHIWGSVVPGHADGYVPGRSAAYENQA